jgi:hypothetical protein
MPCSARVSLIQTNIMPFSRSNHWHCRINFPRFDHQSHFVICKTSKLFHHVLSANSQRGKLTADASESHSCLLMYRSVSPSIEYSHASSDIHTARLTVLCRAYFTRFFHFGILFSHNQLPSFKKELILVLLTPRGPAQLVGGMCRSAPRPKRELPYAQLYSRI